MQKSGNLNVFLGNNGEEGPIINNRIRGNEKDFEQLMELFEDYKLIFSEMNYPYIFRNMGENNFEEKVTIWNINKNEISMEIIFWKYHRNDLILKISRDGYERNYGNENIDLTYYYFPRELLDKFYSREIILRTGLKKNEHDPWAFLGELDHYAFSRLNFNFLESKENTFENSNVYFDQLDLLMLNMTEKSVEFLLEEEKVKIFKEYRRIKKICIYEKNGRFYIQKIEAYLRFFTFLTMIINADDEELMTARDFFNKYFVSTERTENNNNIEEIEEIGENEIQKNCLVWEGNNENEKNESNINWNLFRENESLKSLHVNFLEKNEININENGENEESEVIDINHNFSIFN